MKLALIAILTMAAVTLGACNVHKKSVKHEALATRVTLETLDARVTAIENRNAAVDARVRARHVAPAKQHFTPAPKYDPNFVR